MLSRVDRGEIAKQEVDAREEPRNFHRARGKGIGDVCARDGKPIRARIFARAASRFGKLIRIAS